MGSFIIKIERGDDAWYMEWSTVSDTPACYGMSLQELREWSLKKYGTTGMWDWDERVKRVEATGTSLVLSPETAKTAINCNVCGPEGEELTYDQIIDKYCINRPEPRKPRKPVDHSLAIEQLRLLINSSLVVRHEEMQSPGWQSPLGGLVIPPKVSYHWWDHEARRIDIARLRSYIGAVRVLETRARWDEADEAVAGLLRVIIEQIDRGDTDEARKMALEMADELQGKKGGGVDA